MIPNSIYSALLIAALLTHDSGAKPIWGGRRALFAPWNKENVLKTQKLPITKQLVTPALTTPTIRGGAEVFKTVENVLSSWPLTNVFAYGTLFGGAAVAIDPNYTFETMGAVALEKDSIAEFFAKAIGYIQFGTGLSIILVDKTSLSRAVGFGLLPRVLFLAQTLSSNFFSKMSIKRAKEKVITKLVIASAVVASLITDSFQTGTIVKVVAGINVLGSIPLLLAPLTTLKLFGVLDSDQEENENEKTKVMAEVAGAHLLGYGVYIGALSIGFEPVHALAATVGTYTLYTAKFAASKSSEVLGFPMKQVIGKIIVLAGFTAGLILQAKDNDDNGESD
mmetsp:Transcript_31665/g.38787  ORF Transcript_31665/g.38787 Transcript_31665/m.38787 type:complete len:336 (-) Transcript_31665:149-1156(-)|eukprot:CAMPEP_0172499520 /NCGR_PEP_ID=MMETSP1066-20121228/128201_1 /TAXON_ID=671091 /ORGANISM="Coscinodiscus wailesii, Strain CCMP2513" /LENGTH=335 /DNA_ID=CAMNT_0013273303 /DNA_START=91 /DNA_END=1098 /DNA_ORIENTATION=+